MGQRSDSVLMTIAGIAIVAALIVLPDWFSLIEHVARIVTYEIYGR
jgi:hypothetical protein